MNTGAGALCPFTSPNRRSSTDEAPDITPPKMRDFVELAGSESAEYRKWRRNFMVVGLVAACMAAFSHHWPGDLVWLPLWRHLFQSSTSSLRPSSGAFRTPQVRFTSHGLD